MFRQVVQVKGIIFTSHTMYLRIILYYYLIYIIISRNVWVQHKKVQIFF